MAVVNNIAYIIVDINNNEQLTNTANQPMIIEGSVIIIINVIVDRNIICIVLFCINYCIIVLFCIVIDSIIITFIYFLYLALFFTQI